jgi:hypothetical protein
MIKNISNGPLCLPVFGQQSVGRFGSDPRQRMRLVFGLTRRACAPHPRLQSRFILGLTETEAMTPFVASPHAPCAHCAMGVGHLPSATAPAVWWMLEWCKFFPGSQFCGSQGEREGIQGRRAWWCWHWHSVSAAAAGGSRFGRPGLHMSFAMIRDAAVRTVQTRMLEGRPIGAQPCSTLHPGNGCSDQSVRIDIKLACACARTQHGRCMGSMISYGITSKSTTCIWFLPFGFRNFQAHFFFGPNTSTSGSRRRKDRRDQHPRIRPRLGFQGPDGI